MEKFYGVVKEVYIPKQDNVDIMYSNKIGFIIDIDNKLYKFEDDQNIENAQIMKNDNVVIIKQIIDNKEFIDIRKVEEDYE